MSTRRAPRLLVGALLVVLGLGGCGDAAPRAETWQLAVGVGTLWSNGGPVLWTDTCTASLPPLCSGSFTVVGVDLADLPSAVTRGEVTWASSMYLYGRYDPASATVTVVNRPIPFDNDDRKSNGGPLDTRLARPAVELVPSVQVVQCPGHWLC